MAMRWRAVSAKQMPCKAPLSSSSRAPAPLGASVPSARAAAGVVPVHYEGRKPGRRVIENKHSNRYRSMTNLQGECSNRLVDRKR
jgi:hypothetical protein